MSRTVQDSINWAETFIEYQPMSAGTGGNPAVTTANVIQSTICNPPLCWAWNRAESTALSTIAGTQDYLVNLIDFGYLEKVSLKTADGTYVYEVPSILNTNTLGVSIDQAQPQSVSVKYVIYGTSVALRFLAVPDQVYSVTLTYQKLVVPLTALTGAGGTWIIPDSYLDIYNNLFLGEALQGAGDAGAQYRQRGMAALLSKAEGLSELQKNAFLVQYLSRTSQEMSSQLRTQTGNQARSL
jgi:hypothetical protein